MKLNYLLLLSVSLGIFGCKKESVEESSTFGGSAAKTAFIDCTTVLNNGDTYTVDVFYFLPKGTSVVADYQSRINNLTGFTKTWFANQLATRNNLLANNLLDFTAANGNVTVTIIQGKNEAKSYNGAEGLAAADAEIDAYIATNPAVKHSEHSLVYLPGTAPLKPVNDLTVSFCRTIGKRRVYDVDYPGYNSNKQDQNFSTAFGSFLHELGHSFNLDHNKVPKSLYRANTISLMSYKSTLLTERLFLNPNDAEILKTCQVFNRKSSIAYYKEPTTVNLAYFKGVDVSPSMDGSVSFEFQSDIPVTSVMFYNDPASLYKPRFTILNDYDAFSKVYKLNTPALSGKISQTFSIKDFYDLTPGKEYKMKIALVLENGTLVKRDFFYTVKQDGTIGWSLDTFPKTESTLDKSQWKVIGVSSEQANGLGKYIIDGDLYTAWIPKMNSSKTYVYPNEILIDCSKTVTANTFTLAYYPTAPWTWSKFQVQVSDDAIHFRVVGTYYIGEYKSWKPADSFTFSKWENFRYIKFVQVEKYLPVRLDPNSNGATFAEIALSNN